MIKNLIIKTSTNKEEAERASKAKMAEIKR